MSTHAYHVTANALLPSIAREGLKPHPHEHLGGDEHGNESGIFVEPEESEAAIYHEPPHTTMLRFKTPSSYRWATTDDGEYVHWRDNERPESERHVRQHVRAGGAIASPFLSTEWHEPTKTWKVIQHEGRARMLAAADEDPSQEIPVHVFPRGGDRARHLTHEHIFAPIHPDSRTHGMGQRYLPHKVTHMGEVKYKYGAP